MSAQGISMVRDALALDKDPVTALSAQKVRPMDLYELPFAKIIILQHDIAEVLIDDGTVMNAEMVQQYHDFLLKFLKAPFSLLINKVNSYTYDFDAQEQLATLEQINAMGVVVYNRISRISTEALASIPRDEAWNLKIFADRDTALAWLLSEQETIGGGV
jgi:hypothetical protein